MQVQTSCDVSVHDAIFMMKFLNVIGIGNFLAAEVEFEDMNVVRLMNQQTLCTCEVCVLNDG